MTKINIKDFLDNKASKISKQISFDYRDDKLSLNDKSTLILNRVYHDDKVIGIGFKIKLNVEFTCDRCLKKFKKTIKLKFNREYSPEPEQDQIKIINSKIEVKKPIIKELISSIPVQLICSEDCQGLCQRCGQNLNIKDCGCQPAEKGHPEFKKLEKLKNSK